MLVDAGARAVYPLEVLAREEDISRRPAVVHLCIGHLADLIGFLADLYELHLREGSLHLLDEHVRRFAGADTGRHGFHNDFHLYVAPPKKCRECTT